MNARTSSRVLYLLAKLKPAIWDAIIPRGPRFSVASREYLIAMALKGFSSELGNRGIAKKLAGVQHTLVKFASERFAAEFAEDDWCGTVFPKDLRVPFPEPDPFPWSSISYVALNPQPLPPGVLEIEIGGYLLMLSEATSLEGAASELERIGNSLLRK